MIDTNALNPSTLGSGKKSNFSILGKDTSTTPMRFLGLISSCLVDCSYSSGRRCKVCGPNTISTCGARLWILSPSCDATQPPTPMTKFGFFSLSFFQRPSSENTFSCAFSRIEQVFMSSTSASSGLSVSIMPWESPSTSAIFSESYTFI